MLTLITQSNLTLRWFEPGAENKPVWPTHPLLDDQVNVLSKDK